MKKILPIILCAAIVFSVSGCVSSGTQLTALSTDNVPKADSVKVKDYDDNLDGLEKYLKKRAFLPDMDGTEMSYGMIGAKAGHRYMFTFNNSQVTAEFYEYDLKNLNDEAKKTIESVKKDGKFELLGMTTEATLSDNGNTSWFIPIIRVKSLTKQENQMFSRLSKSIRNNYEVI